MLERIRTMMQAGVIRRVRQTLLATKLAHGALVAWNVPEEKLNDAFDFMAKEDPFSGHVVIRSTDGEVSGAGYRLWTTLKVPVGESLDHHARALLHLTGATEFLLMPAKGVFALGVGHTRRKTLQPGAMADEPATMMTTATVELTLEEWNVLLALKEELTRGPTARTSSSCRWNASAKSPKPLTIRKSSAVFPPFSNTSNRLPGVSASHVSMDCFIGPFHPVVRLKPGLRWVGTIA